MNAPQSIKARDGVLAEVVADFAADPGVLAVFLAGSLAAGTADSHSDIDLRVVVASNEYRRFLDARLSRPAKWQNFLFNEWGEDESCCVSHFQQFVTLDIFYINIDAFTPSPWLRLPIRVFHDPRHVVAIAIDQSAESWPAPNPADIDRTIGKALAYAHETAKRIARGELIYAGTMLDGLRRQITTLEDFEQQRIPGGNSSPKLDVRISPQLRGVLRASCARARPAEMNEALISLVASCRLLILRLHRQYQLARPMANDLVALDSLPADGT